MVVYRYFMVFFMVSSLAAPTSYAAFYDSSINAGNSCNGENRRVGFHEYAVGTGGYWYVTHSFTPSGNELSDEYHALEVVGWTLINHCTSPYSYWSQYLTSPGRNFPSVFAKPILDGQSPKNAGLQCPMSGNSINIANGNKFQKEEDITGISESSIPFERYYNSITSFISTDVGYGWTHNYSRSLTDLRTLGASGASVARADGKIFFFTLNGNVWVPDDDVKLRLEELTNTNQETIGWQLISTDNVIEEYNAQGQLVSITKQNGYLQTINYDLSDRLETVSNNLGGNLTFSYDNEDRITTVTSSSGETYKYEYNTDGNLTKLILPDTTISDDADNPTRTYHYNEQIYTSNIDLPHALTGITDETGTRFATWAYDSGGRAISSERGNGADHVTLDYTYIDDATNPRVTVTNELGKQTTYHYTTIHGVRKVTQVEGHQSANCTAANQSYTYDANGFKDEVTDWEGNKTDYDHDARGLEVQRIEVKGTPQQRVITTQWHPDFRLPTQITEPDRVIDFSYDAQGLLLERKETPVP